MPGTASIQDLPPGLLELCWAPLERCERHRTVPFVCRTWRQQLNSSLQLLQSITVQFTEQHTPARFCSFYEWMLRWGVSHVQQLDLKLEVTEGDNGVWVEEELATILPALLCACGSGGALRELRLEHNISTKNTAWLAGVRQLRLLHVMNEQGDDRDSYLDFDPPAWPLEGLQELCLAADYVTIPASARLPTSLTKLSISGLECDALPSQFTALEQLQVLSLACLDMPSAGYAPLAGLRRLRRLALYCCAQLPACLPQLTGLEALAVADKVDLAWQNSDDEQCASTLEAALPALAGQLTLLALPGSLVGCVPPSLLTTSSWLQALFVLAQSSPNIEALSPGPALPGLRYLSGPLGLLVRSLEVLQAAIQLEFVGAACFSSDLPVLHMLLSWAARHPTLRHLALEGHAAELDQHFHRIADAERHNPALRITRHHLTCWVNDPSQLLNGCGIDVFH